jgi:2-oxoglutarate ferredoxin oxidoreductase subunit beta
MVDKNAYENDVRPTWCPGCGNFGLRTALQRALVQVGLAPEDVIMVTGIGQSGKTNDYMRICGFHGLHGRPLPAATGIKLANHAKKVVVGHGDGDGYGEGGNHFIHAIRRNIGFVDIVHNNEVYALTRGQYSPTSERGMQTPTSPEGAREQPLNAVALALSQGATFVARTYTLNLQHMINTFVEALNHRGYALVEVMQVCVTFFPELGKEEYRNRMYVMQDEGHDSSDWDAAMEKAREYPGAGRIPLGIFYRTEDVPAYEERIATLQKGPLVSQPLHIRPRKDYWNLIYELMTEQVDMEAPRGD